MKKGLITVLLMDDISLFNKIQSGRDFDRDADLLNKKRAGTGYHRKNR
jgi:hypothetical protein